jgi:hypothetical protein
MLWAKLSGLSPATLRHRASLRSSRHVPVSAFVACDSPCVAQKACDLPSLANPARRIRLALFRTFRPTSKRYTKCAQGAPSHD